MVIRYCLSCHFHQIRKEGSEGYSLCTRENCFSQFSKCLVNQALARFLEQETVNEEAYKVASA